MNARDRKKKKRAKKPVHCHMAHKSLSFFNFLVDKSVLFLPFEGSKNFTTTFRNV